jgi:hypothetical protein
MKRHKWLMAVRVFSFLPAGALALFLAGCASTPKPVAWNLEIAAKTPDSGRLDVIGIKRLDKPEWDAVEVNDYWKADNALRKNASRLSFEIVDGKFNVPEPLMGADTNKVTGLGTSKVTVLRTQSIWKNWMDRGSAGLVMIGQFRRDGAAGPDPRKKILPLYKQVWDAEKKTLRFEIQDGRIAVETRESEKAAKFPF